MANSAFLPSQKLVGQNYEIVKRY